MQLTILLSLIHSRGPSLPDKRTSMYDAYMEMFFSRESEKSSVVRDNRDLLIDIHRFLAWQLQTSAESGGDGSIQRSDLRNTLFAYLDAEGEDCSIVDALFSGIVERVGALVSRAQETYEFEVQPLREYFAARHLYETARYPNDVSGSSGDKFDRFRALITNPYWLNVARFYGGCFSKGEMLTLVSELREICERPLIGPTSQPRAIALMLLGDWVFTQYQPAVKAVIEFVTEYPQLRQLLANAESGPSLWSGLPDRSGRSEFINALWGRLASTTYLDEQRAICNAISLNANIEEISERWLFYRDMVEKESWAHCASYLGLFSKGSLEQIGGSVDNLCDMAWRLLISSERYELFTDLSHQDRAKSLILHHNPKLLSTRVDSYLACISTMAGAFQYCVALREEHDVPLRVVMSRRASHEELWDDDELISSMSLRTNAERDLAECYSHFVNFTTAELATSLKPWQKLVSAMRSVFGDCPAVDRIAFLGAGVRAKDAKGSYEVLEFSDDLVSAARFVRMHSGAHRWWLNELERTPNSTQRRRLLLLLLMWGTQSTILKILAPLNDLLNDVDRSDWIGLVNDFRATQMRKTSDDLNLKKANLAALGAFDARLLMFLGLRCSSKARYNIALIISERDIESNSLEAQFALQTLLSTGEIRGHWLDLLLSIKKLYKSGAALVDLQLDGTMMQQSVAIEVVKAMENLPLVVLELADSSLRSLAGAKAAKLLDVAKRDNWFDR